MTMKMMSIAAAALMSAAIVAPASAATITSLPGGTAVTIPSANQTSDAGPEKFGPGVVYTSSRLSAYGYTGGYGFISNGSWSGTPMIGLNAPTGFFTLTFTTAISGFLADVNWSTSYSENASMQAFDAAGTLIDTLELENGSNLVAPGFHGFSETSNSISSIRFNNEYIGIRNISIASVAAVPEPATWAMMIVGFGAVGGAMRRRKSKVTTTLAYA